MSHAREMLDNSPGAVPADLEAVSGCIDALFDCQQVCTACADACVGETDRLELVKCIRLTVACADLCAAAGRIVSRELAGDPGMAPAALEACVKACDIAGGECERHAENMEHCRICAETCRNCQEACRKLLSALSS